MTISPKWHEPMDTNQESNPIDTPSVAAGIVTPELARKWLRDGVPSCEEIKTDCGMLGMWDLSSADLSPETIEAYIRGSLPRYTARTKFNQEISFAVPCAEAIAMIAQSPRLLEVGAGTGYWAALLAGAGCDVVATDAARSKTGYRQTIGRYHEVKSMKATMAVNRHQDRDLLMVWPSYDDGWAARAAAVLPRGRSLYFIGEDQGGCTADDAFFKVLDRDFEEVAECGIPQWDGLHDWLWHYRKRVR